MASPALAARAYSAKVDGVRLAVASLLSSDVPACVEGATALLRDVASAGRQCSTLQVVRIVCLAARVERDAAVAFTASFQHTAPSPVVPRGERAVLARRIKATCSLQVTYVLTPARLGVSQVLSAGQKRCE